jgi:dihydroflavonol-4-reductase
VDVRDVAAGEILAARHAQPGERYVLGGHNLSHLHVLGVIADELGVPVRYLHLPEWSIPALAQSAAGARRLGLKVPIDAQRVRMSRMYMYYNNAKAVEELGFQARPFSESVRATLDWYLRQGVLTPRPALNRSAAFEGGLNG